MSENNFVSTVESLFKGMDCFISTKTVVGEAIHIGDTIILPMADVSFGVAAGAFSEEKKSNGAGVWVRKCHLVQFWLSKEERQNL